MSSVKLYNEYLFLKNCYIIVLLLMLFVIRGRFLAYVLFTIKIIILQSVLWDYLEMGKIHLECLYNARVLYLKRIAL